jgi:2-dehydropantoate 2-reductase
MNKQQEASMHVVIFGTGGVGGYFGGRLAQSGEKVTFIARGDHLQAMLDNGLKVESIKGNFSIQPVTATQDASQVKDVDVVLVCVKTWDVPTAGKAIRKMLGPYTVVVPLENGVEAASQLSEILRREHVLGGLCRISSHIASPGVIQHTGLEPYVAFGELDNYRSARANNLLQAFQRAGVAAEIPDDITAAIWKKFLFISAASGVGAVTRVPFGAFRSIPGTRQLLLEVLKEVYAVALAEGVRLPENSPDDTLAYIDSLPAETMASMQRDIIEGCASELEAQIGVVVRLGNKHSLSTPVQTLIYNSLLPQENLAKKA